MTSRIPPSRRNPEYAAQRAAKIVQQQTPGAGRVAGVAQPGVSQAVEAALRGKTIPTAPPAGGGLSHNTPATQRRAWFGSDYAVTSGGTLSWVEAEEMATGSPVLSGAALDVDWIEWQPGTPDTITVKQDGLYAISIYCSAEFTDPGDAFFAQLLVSPGGVVVVPAFGITPATFAAGMATGVVCLAANATIRVYTLRTDPTGAGTASGTVTVSGYLEIAQIS